MIAHSLLHIVGALKTIGLLMIGQGFKIPLEFQIGFILCSGVLYWGLWRELARERILSRTDPMTSVLNYRGFSEAVNVRLKEWLPHRVLTVAYLDVDNFKGINDRWGHPTGNFVLQLVARTIRKNLRQTDCVARLGGDEFAILLVDVDEIAAQRTLSHIYERLSRSLKQTAWPTTISMGAMVFVDAPPSLAFAIKHVDGLLYESKQAGKNHLTLKSWKIRSSLPKSPKVKYTLLGNSLLTR